MMRSMASVLLLGCVEEVCQLKFCMNLTAPSHTGHPDLHQLSFFRKGETGCEVPIRPAQNVAMGEVRSSQLARIVS